MPFLFLISTSISQPGTRHPSRNVRLICKVIGFHLPGTRMDSTPSASLLPYAFEPVSPLLHLPNSPAPRPPPVQAPVPAPVPVPVPVVFMSKELSHTMRMRPPSITRPPVMASRVPVSEISLEATSCGDSTLLPNPNPVPLTGMGIAAQCCPEEYPKIQDHDVLLPLKNVYCVMQKALPPDIKISNVSKAFMQEIATEFVHFLGSEALDNCQAQCKSVLRANDLCDALDGVGAHQTASPLFLVGRCSVRSKARERVGERAWDVLCS